MNYKIWLIVFGVIAALAIGGSGFYAISGFSKYSDAMESWDGMVGTIESLERRVPYPNKENAEALAEEVAGYDVAVEELYQSLETFQPELNMTLPSTEFQQRVKERVQQFRKYADDGGLEITDTNEFQLGFDQYSSSIPPQELVPILDYELEAIDRLLKTLVDVGVSELASFERDPVPGESGASDDNVSEAVHKYPVRLRFKGNYDSFQSFINELANNKDFFYVVRVLKVKNEVTEGPAKLSETGFASAPIFENPETTEIAGPDMLAEWGYPDVTEEELSQRAAAEGFISSSQDARVLMGQELLNVFMVVDIVRFIKPDEAAAGTEPANKR